MENQKEVSIVRRGIAIACILSMICTFSVKVAPGQNVLTEKLTQIDTLIIEHKWEEASDKLLKLNAMYPNNALIAKKIERLTKIIQIKGYLDQPDQLSQEYQTTVKNVLAKKQQTLAESLFVLGVLAYGAGKIFDSSHSGHYSSVPSQPASPSSTEQPTASTSDQKACCVITDTGYDQWDRYIECGDGKRFQYIQVQEGENAGKWVHWDWYNALAHITPEGASQWDKTYSTVQAAGQDVCGCQEVCQESE